MDRQPQAFAIFHEFHSLLSGGAFLDIIQDRLISRFEADNHQSATRLLHGFQSLVIGMHSGSTGPGEFQGFQFLANIQHPVLPPGKGVIIKEDFLDVGEQFERPLHFCRHVFAAPNPPGMPADRLRP